MDAIEKKVLTSLARMFFTPATVQEVAEAMQLEPGRIEPALSSLVAKGILLNEEGEYWLNPDAEIIAGLFQSHVRGYGFVHVGRDRQYYVAPGGVKGARDGDILLCQVLARESGKAPAVKILDFLARSGKVVAAVYDGQSHLGSVQDGNRKIMIPGRHSRGARDGDIVWRRFPVGRGGWWPFARRGQTISRSPEHCLKESGVFRCRRKGSCRSGTAAGGVARRTDLRQEEMITVDGEYSQDLDDGFPSAAG